MTYTDELRGLRQLADEAARLSALAETGDADHREADELRADLNEAALDLIGRWPIHAAEVFAAVRRAPSTAPSTPTCKTCGGAEFQEAWECWRTAPVDLKRADNGELVAEAWYSAVKTHDEGGDNWVECRSCCTRLDVDLITEAS